MSDEDRPNESPIWLAHVTAVLSSDPRVEACFLLGSAARGAMRPDSDVDVAILPALGCMVSDLDRVALGADLSYAIGRDVELGIMSSRNLVYSREAILAGRRFYVRDKAQADAACATLLGMYAVFNHERREVLDAYCAR